jgi:hypothetical protein
MKALLNSAEGLAHQCNSEKLAIDPARKESLDQLADTIGQSIESNNHADVIVICTHNSRRSHIGQLMLKLAALYYGVDHLYTYSGGTEATALNERVVQALRSWGLTIQQLSSSSNPKYYIPLVEHDDLLDIHFSKPYHCAYNPQKGYIALMVCDHADENCPVVMGAQYRVSCPYIDPKISDDTVEEAKTYKSKVLEIGREMFYVMDLVKGSITD